jgi:heat shock protein HslJ
MKNIFLSLFGAAALLSCSTMSNSKVGKSQPSVKNTSWTLADNVNGAKPTLVIETAKVTGNGGCNNYFGTLTLDETAGNFSAKGLGSTRKMCVNMEVETSFMKMLGEADKYVVNGNMLELYKGNLLLLKFNKL